jgi:hypothetical protein
VTEPKWANLSCIQSVVWQQLSQLKATTNCSSQKDVTYDNIWISIHLAYVLSSSKWQSPIRMANVNKHSNLYLSFILTSSRWQSLNEQSSPVFRVLCGSNYPSLKLPQTAVRKKMWQLTTYESAYTWLMYCHLAQFKNWNRTLNVG